MDQLLARFILFTSTYTGLVLAGLVSVIWLGVVWTIAAVAHRRLAQMTAKPGELSGDLALRYWQHALHEDRTVNETLNFFIVFESVFLGVVGTLAARQQSSSSLTSLFAIIGLVVTLIWSYIQARHQFILDAMIPRLENNFKEYAETKVWRQKWPFHGSFLLSYFLPSVMALLWLIIFALFQGV